MSIAVKEFDISCTFIEPLLGTVPKNADIYRDFVRKRAAEAGVPLEDTEDEAVTVESVADKGWTGFHMKDGQPLLYNYVIRGFFKAACGALRRASGTRSAKLTSYKKVIDGAVFVLPRRIPIILPDGAALGVLERPLRAQTAKGERVALSKSDTAPEGSRIEFIVAILAGDGGRGVVSEAALREWLDYGKLQGLGQWRSGGFGAFTYTMAPIKS